MMKIFTALALLLAVGVNVNAQEDMVVYSQQYKMEANPRPDKYDWTDVGLTFCVMQEEFVGLDASFPDNIVDEDGKGDMDMSLTDKKTRFAAVAGTQESKPCWERQKCGEWHIDESRDGKYRVYMC